MSIILTTTGSFLFGLFVYSRMTNPFRQKNIVLKNIVSVKLRKNQFVVRFENQIKIRKNRIAHMAAFLKSGMHIIASRWGLDPHAKGETVDEIIEEINTRRFSPDSHFLISGDHFSVLYPRSLGIFYHSLLDPRVSRSRELWEQQQALYLKTTAYALMVFEKAKRLSTTVVPVGRRSVTLVNIYAPPSDTLYSLLFALRQLSDSSYHLKRYPYKTRSKFKLQSEEAVKKLLKRFGPSLNTHLEDYLKLVVDPKTGLTKQGLLISGTKDIVKRSCAFYDNVILWKTLSLAMDLELIPSNPVKLSALKHSILETFWLPYEGYFLEDLAEESVRIKQYSSDWLIAVQTGFLDPKVEKERKMLEKCVKHIQADRIDKPFGMRYQNNFAPERLYAPVRLGARSYGSTAIWSHWGMEYIKLLAALYAETNKVQYFEAAYAQLESYEDNIVRHKGFPEVYDEHGEFFRSPSYKSVRQTGWAVNFQQARAMLISLSK